MTIGSAFINTSDRFEPRIAGGPEELEGEDEGTIGQYTAGPTVASSTYGEDRMVVKDQLLLDPYGDKGKQKTIVCVWYHYDDYHVYCCLIILFDDACRCLFWTSTSLDGLATWKWENDLRRRWTYLRW